jgi:hypothetical protein
MVDTDVHIRIEGFDDQKHIVNKKVKKMLKVKLILKNKCHIYFLAPPKKISKF